MATMGIAVQTKRNLMEQSPESRLRNIRGEIALQLDMQWSMTLADWNTPLDEHFDDFAPLARCLQRHFPDHDLAKIVGAAVSFSDIADEIARQSRVPGEQATLV